MSFKFTSMANLISIVLTFFLITPSKFSILSTAAAVAKDQAGCSTCSSCENPCQLPPPSPPPPPPPLPTSDCPPPPPSPSCQTCVYSSPPPLPPSPVQPYTPANGGQFPGIAPPPPNPILPYYPYYYYTPPSASGIAVGFSWKIWDLGLLIIFCLNYLH